MKANEAPEKIFRTTTYLNDKGGQTVWKRQPVAGAENIEYTRTDYVEKAFIIKAQKWLTEIHRVCDITDENGYRIELRELQARFRNYMKGE